jgi:hypothetical protein
VRPEFQELFRTTTNRLVTESHKDFCANTAFRWDLYAKAPRRLDGPEARLREVDDLHYVLTRPGTKLPFEANLGVVTSTVQGPLYETLIDLLDTHSLRLSDVVASERLRGTAPADVIRAVDAGVAMGLFDVTSAPVGPHVGGPSAGCSMPHAFNRALLAADALGGRPLALASELTGTGHAIGDLDAAILHEFVERGRDGLANRVAARLESAGRTLLQDGKPVERPEDRRRMVEAACDAFVSSSLPQIIRLGIVTG